jgi:hypothetical protein
LSGYDNRRSKTISEGTITCTELETHNADGGMDIAFGAADAAGHIQCRIWVLARPSRIVTLSYNRYPPLLSAEAFLQTAREIRSALTVK